MLLLSLPLPCAERTATALTYTLYVLGNTPSDRVGCFAMDISDTGRVVGTCNDHGFIFDGLRPPRELPRLSTPTAMKAERAEAVNEFDEIAGASQAADGKSHMVRWTRTSPSGPFAISDLSQGNTSAGTDIDLLGRVVGWLGDPPHGAMWHGPTIGLQDVSLDFPIGLRAILTGIFADTANTFVVADPGSVTNLRAGRINNSPFNSCPHYLDRLGLLTGRIAGQPPLSTGLAATELLVAGTLQFPTHSDAMLARVDVATLGQGGGGVSSCSLAASPVASHPFALASGVNSSGWVVGLLHPGGNAPVTSLIGFVWDGTGMLNLNTLLPPGSDPVIDAHGINEAGQIAATVVDQINFVPRPAILSICGNGRVELGEDCDDGTLNGAAPSSCCSTFCRRQCGDGDPCTQDTCDARRSCQHTPIAGCDAGKSTEALVGGSRAACEGGRLELTPEPTCVLSTPDAEVRIPIGDGDRALPTATNVTVAAVPTADCAQSFGFGANAGRLVSCTELRPDGQTFAPRSGVSISYHWSPAAGDPSGCQVDVPSGSPFPEGQLVLFAEGKQATAGCGQNATVGTPDCPRDAALTNACVDATFCAEATCRPDDDVLEVNDVRHFSRHALGFNHAPQCDRAVATRSDLWPPNHRLKDVGVVVSDPDGDAVQVTITGVTQDEPLVGLGSGNKCPDAGGIGGPTVALRAERAARSDGRVYHVSFEADDGHAAQCTGTVTVCVPHDRARGRLCADQGSLADSTGPCPLSRYNR